MDFDQLAKTVEWLDKERQKEQKRAAEMSERLNALADENAALHKRVKDLEAETSKAVAAASRINATELALSQVRAEVNKQIETLEKRRAESEMELDRLRQVERDGINRTLADVRKSLDTVARLDKDMIARKEEESRLIRVFNDMQIKVNDVTRRDEERSRVMSSLEEGRRQDAKRVADLQAENTEFRKRVDENRGRLETLEDLIRRNDARLGEMMTLENDRRLSQKAWMESQAVMAAERERAWNDLRLQAEAVVRDHADFSHRMETYSETHRQMRKSLDDYYNNLERLERRINEAAEVQRLSEERFRQEWNTFLADEQKRWTTHMLLRDEQWREHDRQAGKMTDRLVTLEDSFHDLAEQVRAMLSNDQVRLQTLFNLIRESLAEYDQSLTKVR